MIPVLENWMKSRNLNIIEYKNVSGLHSTFQEGCKPNTEMSYVLNSAGGEIV
jgi:hypothetical protein